MASILLQDHAQAGNSSDTCWQDWRLEGTFLVEEVFKFVGWERFFFNGVKGRVLEGCTLVTVAESGWEMVGLTE